VVAQAGNQRGEEVRPEDKMTADSQIGDIFTLSSGMGEVIGVVKVRFFFSYIFTIYFEKLGYVGSFRVSNLLLS
jgi:hypothetical protein